MLKERFLKYFPVTQHVSVDEAMIPYFGRHGAKQFLRNKPVRFGYKIWCICTPSGYLANFEPYEGAGTGEKSQLGVGGSVVVRLVDELPKHRYCVYTDNFFTSIPLITTLADKGVALTGTIRANRTQKCPLKDLKREPRGSMDHRKTSNSVLVVSWNDNNVVNVASSVHGVQPTRQTERYSVAQKMRVKINQPRAIEQYNRFMGGVDRMDQNVSLYRIGIRSKKWWWPMLAGFIDMAMQNAWLIYRVSDANRNRKLDQLAFRSEVVTVYLQRHVAERSTRSLSSRIRPSRNADIRVPSSIRFDGQDHVQEAMETQRRCIQCGNASRNKCKKCQTPLHNRCSAKFHTKPQ